VIMEVKLMMKNMEMNSKVFLHVQFFRRLILEPAHPSLSIGHEPVNFQDGAGSQVESSRINTDRICFF